MKREDIKIEEGLGSRPWLGEKEPLTNKEKLLAVLVFLRWIFVGWWMNPISFLRGYGWCPHCKCTWNWIATSDIRYDVGAGAFPVCKLCFDHLSADKIIGYTDQLAREWTRSGKHDDLTCAELQARFGESVLYLKEKGRGRPSFYPLRIEDR